MNHNPLIFEVSWEVCSQVGGIYTVLRSRAKTAVDYWGDSYWAVGPFRESSARIEFESHPPREEMREVLEQLQHQGVVVHCGRWLVDGRPQALLVDLRSVFPRLGEIRYYLSQDTGISTSDGDYETNDTIAFGHAVADLLMTTQQRLPDRPVLAHFHEWQGATAIPFLRKQKSSIATVFTTHATLVGRSLSAANADLYGQMHATNAEAVAFEHGIGPRFQFEREAAQNADVFTTVSEITAEEAKYFLGRQPEVVLPNGVSVERFAAPHQFQVLHQRGKERIHEFVMGHFFPSYTFDLDKTLYAFIAGRYEYRNKGIDVFIEALSELNRRMKSHPTGTTLVAFIITQAPFRALNVETLNRQAMFDELNATCADIRDEMRMRLVHTITHGKLPDIDDLLDERAVLRLKRMMHAWKRDPLPTIVTHDLHEDHRDPVLSHLRRNNLVNHETDPVKVVFHPEFLTPTSPIMGMEYDQFVRGCNIGVFPSYYEPWGYTPLDCVLRGIPTITSDLSGIGTYTMRHIADHENKGIYVAPRHQASFSQSVHTVAGWMYDLVRQTRRQRIQQRNRVEGQASHFDWSRLVRHYIEAWKLALQKKYPNQPLLPRRIRRKRPRSEGSDS